MQDQSRRALVLSSGVISLILTLGIARFAYTPLLPVMQDQTWLGHATGGWLATFNYIGYLSGALIASIVSNLVIKDYLYRFGLILAVVTTFGMAFTENMFIWGLLRFFAGLSSAAGLLIGSGLLLNWLIRHHHHSELGIHFSGLGLGIAFVSVAVWIMNTFMDWREQWISLGIIGIFLLIPAWRWLPRPDTSGATQSGKKLTDNPPSQRFMILMMIAYMCAGFGYVISATFIVAIVEKQPTLQGQGELVFLVIGLSAAPACIIWDLIARRTGVLTALLCAFILKIVGIILPAFSENLFIVLLSAVLYGGTFIGIVSLVLTMAGRYYPTKPAILMGKFTLGYGLAQIVAPALAGYIAEITGSYNGALYLATGFMAVGTAVIVILRQEEKAMPQQMGASTAL